jgi:hypothetical protein
MDQTQFINLPGFLRILQFFIITKKKKLDVEKIRKTYDTCSILILPPRTHTQCGILLSNYHTTMTTTRPNKNEKLSNCTLFRDK